MTTARKLKQDPRTRIRELFEARDRAVQARADAEKRIETLREKLVELDSSLPGLRQAIKDREYDWRMAQAKLDVHEATAADVDAAEKAIDAARGALEEAEGKIEATEDLIAEANNKIPGLKVAEEFARQAPWRAVADSMEPEVQEAARILRRYYTAILNTGGPFQPDTRIFLDRTVNISGVSEIAAELEEEYRR